MLIYNARQHFAYLSSANEHPEKLWGSATLTFHGAHGQAFDDVFLEDHGQDDGRCHDGHRRCHHAAPVHFGIGDKVIDRDAIKQLNV